MKIFAVARNYAEHNKELNFALYNKETDALQTSADTSATNSETQDEGKKADPVLFLKADSSLLKDGRPLFLPDHLGRIDYETEIVVRICRLGKCIPERFAHRYYDAVTCGIDFTARELQAECIRKGLPWTLCKGFDGAAAIGDWIDKEKFIDVQRLHFHLDISRDWGNGVETRTVQEGCTSDMLTSIDRTISYLSQYYTLKTGDLLFTGTPVGVGPVHIDDHLTGYVEGYKVLEFNIK